MNYFIQALNCKILCSYHILENQSRDAIDDNFQCHCITRNKYCKYCKAESHENITCLENILSLKEGLSKSLINCPEDKCDSFLCHRQDSYFLICHNEGSQHCICIVCNKPFYKSNHDACLILFSGISVLI